MTKRLRNLAKFDDLEVAALNLETKLHEQRAHVILSQVFNRVIHLRDAEKLKQALHFVGVGLRQSAGIGGNLAAFNSYLPALQAIADTIHFDLAGLVHNIKGGYELEKTTDKAPLLHVPSDRPHTPYLSHEEVVAAVERAIMVDFIESEPGSTLALFAPPGKNKSTTFYRAVKANPGKLFLMAVQRVDQAAEMIRIGERIGVRVFYNAAVNGNDYDGTKTCKRIGEDVFGNEITYAEAWRRAGLEGFTDRVCHGGKAKNVCPLLESCSAHRLANMSIEEFHRVPSAVVVTHAQAGSTVRPFFKEQAIDYFGWDEDPNSIIEAALPTMPEEPSTLDPGGSGSAWVILHNHVARCLPYSLPHLTLLLAGQQAGEERFVPLSALDPRDFEAPTDEADAKYATVAQANAAREFNSRPPRDLDGGASVREILSYGASHVAMHASAGSNVKGETAAFKRGARALIDELVHYMQKCVHRKVAGEKINDCGRVKIKLVTFPDDPVPQAVLYHLGVNSPTEQWIAPSTRLLHTTATPIYNVEPDGSLGTSTLNKLLTGKLQHSRTMVILADLLANAKANRQVTVIVNAPTSVSKMTLREKHIKDGRDNTRVQANRLNLARLEKAAQHIIGQGKQTLIVSRKAHVERFAALGEASVVGGQVGSEDRVVEARHFANTSGSNNYRGFDQALGIGTTTIPPDALENMVAALTGEPPDAYSMGYYSRLYYADGLAEPFKVPAIENRDMDALLQHGSVSSQVQGPIGRIDRDGDDAKMIYLMCNVPIPHSNVRYITLDDFEVEEGIVSLQAHRLLSNGIIGAPRWIAARGVLGTAYKSEAAARKDQERLERAHGSPLPPAHFRLIKARFPFSKRQAEKIYYDPALISDPERFICNIEIAFAEAHGVTYSPPRFVR